MRFEGESALIVPVPEAEPAAGRWRMRHDPAAMAGVAAHVTILHPFVEREGIDDAVLEKVKAVASATAAFGYRLGEVRWFDDEVLYVAPDPDDAFRALIAAYSRAFPDHPPYGGEHPDPTPHLTIGHAGTGDLRPAAAAVAGALPIQATADVVELIVFGGARWSVAATFPLAPEPQGHPTAS